jgi:tetratricopeptide (TPR) repeat protein
MRRSSLILLICALLLTVPFTASMADDARDAFTAGQTAFAEDDYLRALAHFQRARQQGLDGPAIHYNIGVCHYRLGEYREAQAAFALIADRYPAMRALAQYNLGLVARRLGDHAQADAMFRAAFAGASDDKIRQLARLQIGEPVAELPSAPSQWFTMIDARVGHDDNVVLVAEDLPITGGYSADSAFTEAFAFVSGPLSAGEGLRFDGTLYTVRYADASFYNQNVLRAGGVYQWRFGRWRAEAGPHLAYSTLDGDGYERRIGAGLRLRRAISDQTTFGVRYVHDEVDNRASPAARRTRASRARRARTAGAAR